MTRQVWMVALMLVASIASARGQDLTERNIPEIVSASQGNELRFNQNYRGRRIIAAGVLEAIEQVYFVRDRYLISVSTPFGDLHCVTADKAVLREASNWNVGQAIKASGIVVDTLLGIVQLGSGCTVGR